MLSKGMMDKARRAAEANVKAVHAYVEQGVKLVGLEPSCILSFRDDYLDLLPGSDQAGAVGESAMLIEEFLAHARETDGVELELKKRPAKKILLHGHCHQKALVGTGLALEALQGIPDCDVAEIPSGCCGMAGSFGFEKDHYDISMAIGEQVLFPAVRAEADGAVVVSEGVSCRQQIEHGTGTRAKHLVEVLAEAL